MNGLSVSNEAGNARGGWEIQTIAATAQVSCTRGSTGGERTRWLRGVSVLALPVLGALIACAALSAGCGRAPANAVPAALEECVLRAIGDYEQVSEVPGDDWESWTFESVTKRRVRVRLATGEDWAPIEATVEARCRLGESFTERHRYIRVEQVYVVARTGEACEVDSVSEVVREDGLRVFGCLSATPAPAAGDTPPASATPGRP